MAAAERIEIGFSGGQVIAIRLAAVKLKDLRKALDKGSGWSDVETEDGAVAIDLSQVVFVRTNASANTIGFGG